MISNINTICDRHYKLNFYHNILYRKNKSEKLLEKFKTEYLINNSSYNKNNYDK